MSSYLPNNKENQGKKNVNEKHVDFWQQVSRRRHLHEQQALSVLLIYVAVVLNAVSGEIQTLYN